MTVSLRQLGLHPTLPAKIPQQPSTAHRYFQSLQKIFTTNDTVTPNSPCQKSPNATSKMGRLHSNGKGISASAIPYSRTPPSWFVVPPNPQESEIQRERTHTNAANRLKTTPEQVVEQICKLAKKGATPSQIGVVLRDSHGIAQVKVVTGTSSLSFSLPIWW